MSACGAFNNFILPLRAQLARVTFAAALVSKKVCQPLQHVAHVSAIVEDHNCAGAKRQAGCAQVLERQNHVEIFLNGKGTRGPADERRLKLPARFEPAREIEQQVAQGDPKWHLVKSGPLNCPDTQNSFGPLDRSVPSLRYSAAPRSMISGTLQKVSTLLITVGLPNKPWVVGNGGLIRGRPRLPSMDSNSAVSSPQI